MSNNLFGIAGKTIVADEGHFWDCISRERTEDSVFDDQGDAHAEIDMRLVDKIEKFLTPKIGDWESSEHWYHNLDFYGDGIRSLSFSWHMFRPEFIAHFQSLLSGEHEPFCILCQLHKDFSDDKDTGQLGGIAVFSNRILISRKVAQKLTVIER